MPSLNSLCGGAVKNGEPSPLGSSTGPGCKALVFKIDVQYFFQNKMRHLSSGTSTATLKKIWANPGLFFVFLIARHFTDDDSTR